MRKFILSLVITLTLAGCNFVSDYGSTKESKMSGYVEYTNKTLNVSVLTPESWKTQVTIGGVYVMRPADQEGIADISVSSSSVERLMGGGASKSTTLDEYKAHRRAFITEENIGPQLTVSMKKTTLSGHDAYELLYSMLPEGETEYLVFQETFTVVEGTVYRLSYGVSKNNYDEYLEELGVIKTSYQILR